jgi:hypothetical protein
MFVLEWRGWGGYRRWDEQIVSSGHLLRGQTIKERLK